MTASPDRIRWLTARTANASRRALLIAGIGALVVIGALLTFVLVPRRADRQLAAALAALPPLRDTVGLRAERDGAQRMLDSAVAQLAAARPLASPITPTGADSLRDSTPSSRGTAALEQLVARVRQAPLVESYRALVASPALRGNAAVRAALDTIEALNREREASAALGGPDARYAALTARLTALGQRLERLAESELARRRAFSAVPDSMAPSATLTDTTTTPLLSAPLPADTVLEAAVAQQRLVLARTDSALAAARAINDDLLRQQAALRATAQAPIPPLAMLLAALVLGLAVGFAVVLARELRRPTVSTADELLAITGARVLLHDADARRTDGAPDTWVTLHYALTPLDDAAQRITVLADRPVLVEAVRRGLAAEASELTLTGATTARSVASDADVVLVAQRGRTALPWLTEVVRALALESRRIRAVVLWTGQLPLER
ncbi:MAG: hypothetical protein K2R93_10740 [Gemmatimonadaceae bacterium]|nr:hypothetical protein [Gemmatimonadaceae bacterium]